MHMTQALCFPKKHQKFIHTPLDRKRLWPYMKPVYERLASEKLLERCESHATQNSNESLHSVVWSKCPKVGFYSKKRIEMGLLLGISEFNFGAFYCSKLREIFQITDSSNATNLQSSRMNKRLANSLKREKVKVTNKQQKQREARAKLNAELEKVEGGLVYGPGIASVPV